MTLWQQRKQLMRTPNFVWFLLCSFITIAAGAMCYIVLTWHVVNMPGHNALMSSVLVSLGFWLPSVILSPLAGIVVDRYPRKKVIMICNFLRMLSLVVIALCLLHVDSLWLCCLLNLINGILFTVLGPAVMALVREIVPNDKLLAANSTIDVCVELANVVGMGLASLLIILVSITASLFIIAGSIGVGVILMLFIRQKKTDLHHHLETTGFWQQFKDGLVYLIKRPTLALLYLLNAVLFIQFMISPVLLAPFIKVALHGTGRDFSITELFLCVGIIVGSFLIPWLCEQYGRIRVLCSAIVWTSVVFYAISISRSIDTVMFLYALLGVGLPMWSVIASYAQEYTAKNMQGRTQAVANTLSSLCILLVYLMLSINHSHMMLAHGYWFCTGLGVLALFVLYGIARGASAMDDLRV